MKIFYFIDSLNIGGSETQAVQTAVRMAARGHRLVFGCLHLNGPLLNVLKQHNIETIEFNPGRSLLSFSAFTQILRLSKYIRRSAFDVVHNHDLYSNLMGVPAARLAGVPTVISVQRDLSEFEWYTPRNRQILRWIQRKSHRVIVNSHAIRAGMVSDGFPPEKVIVLHNGVTTEQNAPGQPRRESLLPNFGSEDFVVTMVANMHVASKGHKVLIDAVSMLCTDHPRLRIALIGDGKLRPDFETYVEQLQLREFFLFLGHRSDVSAILNCSDAGVLPSLSEGFPNSVLEYMAAGLPIVATDVGGIPEIVESGVNGILIRPNDSKALARALADLIGNRCRSIQYGKNGRQLVQEQFTFTKMVERLELLYAEPT